MQGNFQNHLNNQQPLPTTSLQTGQFQSNLNNGPDIDKIEIAEEQASLYKLTKPLELNDVDLNEDTR